MKMDMTKVLKMIETAIIIACTMTIPTFLIIIMRKGMKKVMNKVMMMDITRDYLDMMRMRTKKMTNKEI